VGADDLHITGEYLEANTNLYGVVCKVETDQAYDTEEKLRIWAADRLRRHCEPTVTITINGLELSAETGEPLDKLVVGTVCRVPVPELGVVMAEKITRLNFKDVIRDPVDVTVTLANNREDVASLFKREKQTTEKASRSGARGGKKKNEKIEDAESGMYSVLQRTASEIYMQVTNTKTELQSKIDILDHSISLVVEGTGDNAHIKPAAITAAITDSNGYLSSAILISADRITLDGRTTIASVMTVADRAVRINVPLETSEIRLRGQSSAANLTASNMERVIVDAWVDSATHTLKLRPLRGDVVSFKKATSISGRWSGSTGTVATFEYQTDDASIPTESTYLTLHAETGVAYVRDPSGIMRARISVPGGSSYSNSSVLVYDHFDDGDELYYYRSEDLITRKSVGATKTVHYN
jgi:hypothetical protein